LEKGSLLMNDLLGQFYPWIKSLHIVSVMSWMAGMFYLPRLFVYHAERGAVGTPMHETFVVMERKLLKLIMNPAMIATWVFGLLLVLTPGAVDWGSGWAWVKLAAVLAMTGMHGWLGVRRKEFAAGMNTRPGRTYRLANEVPTVLMLVIVIMVVVRPF
jgi:protoporphyrinogen IX oxidase